MADSELRQAERDFNSETTDANAARLLRLQARSGLTHSKVYLVTRADYQYDDNYHHRTDGYSVSQVYASRERAEKAQKELLRKEFLNCSGGDRWARLGEWAPEGESLFEDFPDELRLALEELEISTPGQDYEDINIFGQAVYDAHKSGKLSDQILDQIIEASSLEFFGIVEMQLQDGLCGEMQ